ncbi:MAG: hypothetical protein V7K50_29440 [Nostoc sp.]
MIKRNYYQSDQDLVSPAIAMQILPVLNHQRSKFFQLLIVKEGVLGKN